MIRVSETDGVRTVTLDRPEARNALTPRDLDRLAAAVTEAATPVVLLRGAGSAFCAGADLDAVAALDREGAASFARHGQRTARAIASADAAVVAGVDGAARGGGVEFALACDLRVATPDATFAEPGVTFGLFGAWGGTVRLPRVVGPSDAADLALTGRVVDAETARRMGLVSRVVDDPLAVARTVADNDADAVRVLTERLRDDADDATREDREAAAFADLLAIHSPALRAARDGRERDDDREQERDGDGKQERDGDGEQDHDDDETPERERQ